MSEFILPFEEKHNISAALNVPIDIYRGWFTDGECEYKVIIDSDNRPQIKEGYPYDDPIHDVSVYKTTLGEDSVVKEEVPSGEAPYPFTERVELTNIVLPLSRILEAYDEKTQSSLD